MYIYSPPFFTLEAQLARSPTQVHQRPSARHEAVPGEPATPAAVPRLLAILSRKRWPAVLMGCLCHATGDTAPAMSKMMANHRSVFDSAQLQREMPRNEVAAPLLETPQCARACSAHAVALDSGAIMFLVNSSNTSVIHGLAPASVLLADSTTFASPRLRRRWCQSF